MNKERFKNYGLWAAILALIPMVLELFGITLVPEKYKQVCVAILSILVMAGILNNPNTECKWFLDDSCKVTDLDSSKKLVEAKETEERAEEQEDTEDKKTE